MNKSLLGTIFVLLAACGEGLEAEPSPEALRQAVMDPLLEQLQALPGTTVKELSSKPKTRSFLLTITQPVDHFHPRGATFQQRVLLLHRDVAQPMVLSTTGYGLFVPVPRDNEISAVLAANSVIVEHRYFEASTPSPADYHYLNVQQAAYDHHHVVELLKPIYSAKWISTGASKGGMTSLYHRHYFPKDVDGTVAYVAPQSYGTDDLRYQLFLERVGGSACRQKIIDFQNSVLKRRAELLPLFAQEALDQMLTYKRVGGLELALEHAVQELRFAFWQYGKESDCDTLPAGTAPAGDLKDALNAIAGPGSLASDQALEDFGSYYYQAGKQLGSYGPLELHIRRELQHPGTYRVERYSPEPVGRFDALAMPEMQAWLSLFGERIMLVYGENDPWSASAFSLGRAQDSFRYFVPGGNHGSFLHMLPPAQKAQADDALARWSGVTPAAVHTLAPQPGAAASAFVTPAEWKIDRRPRRRLTVK